MAKRRTATPVPKDVHEWLSRNGRMGGSRTGTLIRLGKKYAKEHGIDVREEVEKELESISTRRGRKRAA